MATQAGPKKSTTVRPDSSLKLATTRAAFKVFEVAAPAVGARWAETLWFTLPTAGRQPANGVASGTRLELSVDGRRVVGEAWGDGPAIYLQHGWGGYRRQLDALVEPLTAAGYRVITFDALSHGDSDPGPSGQGKATGVEFASVLSAVVAANGPAHAVVAHSAGCLSTALALRDGLSAERVAFIAPLASFVPLAARVGGQLGLGPRQLTRMMRLAERRVGKPLPYFDVPPLPGHLASHGRPVPSLLLVHDAADREIPRSDSEVIAKAWPDARLITTTGLGHRRILRDPGVVTEVAAFVTGPADRPAGTLATARGPADT
jgi:pimeloyl-ACP methyl ester carboxylesterase